MVAIEFQAVIHNGVIKIPENYRQWREKPVKVVLLAADEVPSPRRSALDILAQAPGHRLFHTAAEVDAHLRAERDAWVD
jgi:hypothetical protein